LQNDFSAFCQRFISILSAFSYTPDMERLEKHGFLIFTPKGKNYLDQP